MPSRNFRKLDMVLSVQPTLNSQPFFAAGLLLAFAIFLMFAYAYFHSDQKHNSLNQQNIKKINRKQNN
jgi:high-affinity Fe2+/Pb2+ permease